LGRVLDKLYLTGLEQIFTSIALEAAKKFSISTETIHLDSSSFHVHGEYESAMPQVTLLTSKNNPDDLREKLINEVVVPQPISITYGYSRDHRPDLKQFILDLICSGDNDVPLFLRVTDGDEADQATFGQILCNFKQQLNLDSLMVADSALYSASNLDQKIIETETRSAGRFVLATNLLDVEELSNDEMLFKYKEQQSSERGFSFLKDPLFFTDSVFLKSAERVSALALLMGLCLLVYTLTQRQLRQTLKSTHSGIKNQLGKLTDNPTLRWIFQCFQSVHLLRVNQAMQISNLTDERLWILRFFPAFCRRYYLLV
jgi:transposase